MDIQTALAKLEQAKKLQYEAVGALNLDEDDPEQWNFLKGHADYHLGLLLGSIHRCTASSYIALRNHGRYKSTIFSVSRYLPRTLKRDYRSQDLIEAIEMPNGTIRVTIDTGLEPAYYNDLLIDSDQITGYEQVEIRAFSDRKEAMKRFATLPYCCIPEEIIVTSLICDWI